MPNKSPLLFERLINLYDGVGELKNSYSSTDIKYKYCEKCHKNVKGHKKLFVYGKKFEIVTHTVPMIEYECEHLKSDLYIRWSDLLCYENGILLV